MIKKQISFLLMAAQMLMVVSCMSGNTPVTPVGSDSTMAADSKVKLTRANYPDTVPADLDFGGKTVTLISRHDIDLYKWEFYAEEETGEILNDAIYDRNRKVEERLNVNIVVLLTEGTWNNWSAFTNVITGSAMAGDGAIDIVPFYAFEQASLASQGLYINLLDDSIKYLNLDQPWWYQSLVESATINGKLYFATGDISISSIAMMAAIAFNKKLAGEYLNDIDLYQIVRDGKWTFDTLLGYSKDIYIDVNGNSIRDEADIYGFDGGRSDQFIHSANVPITKIDDNGVPVLALNNERMIKLVDTVQAFYSTFGYAPSTLKYESKNSATSAVSSITFEQGHVIFSNRYVRDIATLREMKDDYGVLPMPKLDENQEKYYTTLADSYSQVAIVAGTDVLDAACATMELLAAESYRSVTDTYYETVLKVKNARDEDTAEMLDILRMGVDVDFAEVFGKLINNPVGKMRESLQEKCTEFSSTYAAIEQAVNQKILNLYDIFD